MIPMGGGRFVRPTCEGCECELDALEPGYNYCEKCSTPGERGDAVHLCPFCGSDDISGDSWEQDGPTVSQVVDCLDCGETWVDSYQFVGFERVERPVDDAETQCHDCRLSEPANGWAEEAPSFRLCWGCASARSESSNGGES